MKNKTIQGTVDKIASNSNINKNVTPHVFVFRHISARLAIENGIELGDLEQLLGHESANTTFRYTAVSQERKHHKHKRLVQ